MSNTPNGPWNGPGDDPQIEGQNGAEVPPASQEPILPRESTPPTEVIQEAPDTNILPSIVPQATNVLPPLRDVPPVQPAFGPNVPPAQPTNVPPVQPANAAPQSAGAFGNIPQEPIPNQQIPNGQPPLGAGVPPQPAQPFGSVPPQPVPGQAAFGTSVPPAQPANMPQHQTPVLAPPQANVPPAAPVQQPPVAPGQQAPNSPVQQSPNSPVQQSPNSPVQQASAASALRQRTAQASPTEHATQNPWLDERFDSGGPTPPTEDGESRRPLVFLIFAAAVLLVTLMIVFFVKVMMDGRSAANPGTEPSVVSPSDTPSGNSEATPTNDGLTNDSTDVDTASVRALVDDSDCSASSDFAVFEDFARVADESGTYRENEALIDRTLNGLSEKCGAEYTLDLTERIKDSSTKISNAATNRDWWHLASPAPEGATSVNEFTTAQNNIRCKFDGDTVNCSIYAYDYPSPEGCEGKTATYHLGLAGSTTADCESALNSSVVVDYGTTVHNGSIWCSVSQTEGITCTSELSGHGFQLKRASDRTF